MDSKNVAIHCAACGEDTFLLKKPQYEGFTRTGENLTCASCGHVYESEAVVPFKERREIKVFTEADRPAEIRVFKEEEKHRLCRYCKHYLINPFTQWCSFHRKEVEATDICNHFEKKPEPVADDGSTNAIKSIL